ncbi:hypothetical protein Ct61P_01722 [Colletotrichum tofieldiae]|nr:hypothetical protein Ct61P_01722 [Colletotrichum tofieldiae]
MLAGHIGILTEGAEDRDDAIALEAFEFCPINVVKLVSVAAKEEQCGSEPFPLSNGEGALLNKAPEWCETCARRDHN